MAVQRPKKKIKPAKKPIAYDLADAVQYCRDNGLVFDFRIFNYFEPEMRAVKLTNTQANACIKMHAKHVAMLFEPRSYSFKQRVAIAIHFLFKLRVKK